MDIRFIAQPQENAQLGALLTDSLLNSIGIKGGVMGVSVRLIASNTLSTGRN